MTPIGPNSEPIDPAEAIRAISHVSYAIAAEPAPRRALWHLVSAIRTQLPVDRVGIFAHLPHLNVVSRVVGVSETGEPEYEGQTFRVHGADTPLLRVIRGELPHYFSKQAPEEFPHARFHPGVRSLAVLPIMAGGEVMGALAADNCITGRTIEPPVLEPLRLCTRLAALPLFTLRQQRERERAAATQWHTLRAVFQAVTQGKVRLCDHREIAGEWPTRAEWLPIRSVNDIPEMRAEVRRYGTIAGMAPERARDLELCVSEAATNALLHGEGGAVCIGRREERVRVRVRDWGHGISLDDLPSATLQPGWSSRRSMGLGFTVITQTADRVLLHTGLDGTTVIIEMAVEPESNIPVQGNPMLWGDTLTL